MIHVVSVLLQVNLIQIHICLLKWCDPFYHLLAQKIIVIDMLKPINLEEAIDIKSIDESKLKKVKYG